MKKSDEGKQKRPPTPAEIVSIRNAAGLTQEEAANLIYKTRQSWINWETGILKMNLANFELFCFKTKTLIEEREKERQERLKKTKDGNQE